MPFSQFRTLHSNLVLFKCYLINRVGRHLSLYIPIWFYSNFLDNFSSSFRQATLHSNLVLFKCMTLLYDVVTLYLYIPIWFYSNLCQCLFLRDVEVTLHSNLVLFKCETQTVTSFIFDFTFQSGSIQMLIDVASGMCLPIFTFQSGSIQMT